MKQIFFLLNISIFFGSLSASDWRDHWVLAKQYFEEDQYDLAENEFDLTITGLESNQSDVDFHPYVYTDRAFLLTKLDRPSEALIDLEKALASKNINRQDRLEAVTIQICAFAALNMEKELEISCQEFRKLQAIPQIEITEKNVIVRNIPSEECKCCQELLKKYLVYSGYCENFSDIQILKSGVLIGKKNQDYRECKCDCKKNQEIENNAHQKDANCKWWCNTFFTATAAWCAKTFKAIKWVTACVTTAEGIKEKCHECCQNGEFYKNCIQPYDKIIDEMGLKYMDAPKPWCSCNSK